MPNDSTSGFTDQQLQQIREVAQSVADDSLVQVADSFGTVTNAVVSSVSESVPSAVSSALDSRSGQLQAVELVSSQYESIQGSLSMLLALSIFVAALVGLLLGSRLAGAFTDGWR